MKQLDGHLACHPAAPARANRLAGLFAPATVDVFAGLGGWSIGTEQAFVEGGYRDRYIDLMINHWDVAVSVHQANHPLTQHLRANVLEVDPNDVLLGRRIVHAHFSPDCTDHSKAKGGKPRRKEIRALADVVIVWAGKRRPDVITLENVEEFQQWGPLLANGHPDPRKRGQEFRRWVAELEALGYVVEWRELRACDYGAPTTRKRLFVIAKCNGKPIVWPERTHGPAYHGSDLAPLHRRGKGSSPSNRAARHLSECPRGLRGSARGGRGVLGGGAEEAQRAFDVSDARRIDSGGSGRHQSSSVPHLKPYRTAAECIDWHEPMLSIFATRPEARRWAARVNVGREKHQRVGVPQRPLKPNTQKRLAGGLWKWVLNHAEPFIVNIQNATWGPDHFPVGQPMPTVTATPKGGAFAGADIELASFTSTLNHAGDEHRAADLREPLATVTGANEARAVVGAELAGFVARTDMHQSNSGCTYGAEQPLTTITTANGHAAIGAEICPAQMAPVIAGAGGATYAGKPVPADRPLGTVMTNDRRAVVTAALASQIETGGNGEDQDQVVGRAVELVERLHGRRGRKAEGGVPAAERVHHGQQGGGDDVLPGAPDQQDHAPGHPVVGFTAGAGGRAGQSPSTSAASPLPTVCGKADRVVACVELAGFTVPRYGEREGQAPRSGSIEQPLPTITGTDNGAQLAAVALNKHNLGVIGQGVDEPIGTVTGIDHHSLLAVHLTNYHNDGSARGQDAREPIKTLDTQNRFGTVAAHLLKFKGTRSNCGAGMTGCDPNQPLPTITADAPTYGVSAVYLSHMYTSNTCGGQGDPRKPLKTITSGGQHANVCVVYLSPYYGSDSAQQGHTPAEPMPTVVGKARFGLAGVEAAECAAQERHWLLTPAGLRRARRVATWARKLLGKKVERFMLPVVDAAGNVFHLLTATVRGALHLVTDVLMRMLRPRELARAQGFDDSYVIDRTADGRRISRADQVKLIGNSVPPAFARAIVKANVVDQGLLDESREAVSA